MCGIFAYFFQEGGAESVTRSKVTELLLAGLRALEYRGYDSAGLSLEDKAGQIQLFKSPGGVDKLEGVLSAQTRLTLTERANAGGYIAHTRWATHGEPSARNSHPHGSDKTNAFAVVHNGIITNHAALKRMLVGRGFEFASDTDTEVVAVLALCIYRELLGAHTASGDGASSPPFVQVVEAVMSQIDGAFALVFKSAHYPGEMVAARRGSPVIIGIVAGTDTTETAAAGQPQDGASSGKRKRGEDASGGAQYFISSDPAAILHHTRQMVTLEDDDVVAMDAEGYRVFSARGRRATEVTTDERGEHRRLTRAAMPPAVERAVNTIELELSSIMKGSFSHFMQKEIFEQPESVLNTMRGRLNVTDGTIKLGGIAEHIETLRRGRTLRFIACGTSFHAALHSRSLLEELAEMPVQCDIASDFVDRSPPMFRDDVCVFISQSGETADTLAALRHAKRCGTLCIGITNTVGSAIARETTCGLHINAGPEIGVASTKAYTSQIVALTLFALVMSEDSISKAERRQEIIDALVKLPDDIRRVLATDEAIRELTATAALKSASSMLCVGRGYQYATAVEGALKIKEISYVHSEGVMAGELKHGPLALVDDRMPILFIATRDRLWDHVSSAFQQIMARCRKGGGPSPHLIVLCNEGDEPHFKGCTVLAVPRTADCVQGILNVIPMQLLSYHMATSRGCNVDQPRNLAKSVTVQ